ncbi:VOC family protein [Sphaerisporangium corydalis]|uniref:VOC family protein n=1 Tax=Sphaerisporangium corydalis TaxID=1441875 RepID=A0ABV9ENM5_9ACTN|nr:VOC family protein [Sphaerisporangium corydalis]
MPIHRSYEPGAPCWVDYAALDPEGAKAFYGELFGWEFEEAGGYGFVRLDGQVVGGFGRVAPGMGLPASWNTYLATKDADAGAVRVKELGGSVVFGPIDAGHDGRLLFAVDPGGAAVGLWQGHWADGIVVVDEPGTWCRNELWARDGAGAFYDGVFGATGVATAVRAPMAGTAARWVTYFMTGDGPAALATAERLGATIAARHGRATILYDPWGALFALTPR